ncbi:RodZ family helix-turn-helix domain-containing protein [Desulfopila sp. IMCC35008]|uniref:helix-turn-helix domain-containing protein n=1 Tax=Desulfopila sp. IMCC35008 TaxID=2653858 RepID=UPI0013D6D12B|nr:helix-turn-helix transcriptional regulator [Desulfopila sp. IMCC35008]
MSETSDKQTENKFESLGSFLKKTRVERGLELEQIIEETKVSASTLRAIEADDFDALPADAFARGLYAHYATALRLNKDEIVARFFMERNSHPSVQAKQGTLPSQPQPPGKKAKQISGMAEPTGVSPISSLGFFLLLLIVIAGTVCWYLSINPATYLSAKLRGISQQTTQEQTSPVTDVENDILAEGEPASTAIISTALSPPSRTEPADQQAKYIVAAQFPSTTTVTVTIDDNPPQELTYSAGQSVIWPADKKLVLVLPGQSDIKLTLNDIPLSLPDTKGDTSTITIPEYLLE